MRHVNRHSIHREELIFGRAPASSSEEAGHGEGDGIMKAIKLHLYRLKARLDASPAEEVPHATAAQLLARLQCHVHDTDDAARRHGAARPSGC